MPAPFSAPSGVRVMNLVGKVPCPCGAVIRVGETYQEVNDDYSLEGNKCIRKIKRSRGDGLGCSFTFRMLLAEIFFSLLVRFLHLTQSRPGRHPVKTSNSTDVYGAPVKG